MRENLKKKKKKKSEIRNEREALQARLLNLIFN